MSHFKKVFKRFFFYFYCFLLVDWLDAGFVFDFLVGVLVGGPTSCIADASEDGVSSSAGCNIVDFNVLPRSVPPEPIGDSESAQTSDIFSVV